MMVLFPAPVQVARSSDDIRAAWLRRRTMQHARSARHDDGKPMFVSYGECEPPSTPTPKLMRSDDTHDRTQEHATKTINPPRTNTPEPRQDAESKVEKGPPFGASPPAASAQPMETKGARDHAPMVRSHGTPSLRPTGGELAPSDHDVLAWVVLLRFASYRQLQALVGGDRHVSTLRKRIGDLIDRGFLIPWDRPGRRRRGQRYVLPTQTTLRRMIPYLREATMNHVFAPLITEMLPQQRRPFDFATKDLKKWLPHQLEVNELVTRIRLARPSVLFASTWEAPFSTTLDFVDAPQPDYVLVEEDQGAPTIVFGEHDRGTGTIATFIERKLDVYAALASFPDVCKKKFGIASFRVDVTVIDVEDRNPMRRLRALIAAAEASTHPELFRFTLGGWLYACTSENVWFSVSRVPVKDSLHFPDHAIPAAA